MIADLLRNDLARVCRDGTLREDAICELKSFPEVHHLVSRIEGQIREETTFVDAIRAAFPCGSITGAPKIAAMAAIAEIEGEGRGPYCGTIFMRTRTRGTASVAIRTAAIDRTARIAEVRSGGGITILSDPGAEYEEADAKAYLFRMLTGRNDRRHR
jgi:para-aminobenzoate synthetase component 1